jgi:N-acyl homoserine lactone hydrolase
VADDIRLYMFQSGILKTFLHSIKLGQGLGEPYDIPVPWYLITHPKGNVVIDGGNAAEVVDDPKGHWAGIYEVYWPEMTAEQAVVPALRNAGFDPADVRYVVQSHLHLDHTGALAAIDEFPNAKVVVARKEYDYAQDPDWYAAAGYIKADYSKPGIDWLFLETHDDGYDLFDDGTVRIWQSPGHSPGHQSFEVTLPESGAMLLTVDAAYTTDHWEEKALPGFLASTVDTVRSVRKLHRIAARSDSTVVTGHDPDAWPKFKQAPEFYD